MIADVPRPGRLVQRVFRAIVVALALLAGVSEASAGNGKPAGPVNVVLMHGWTDTGAIFDPLVGVLEKQGYRCFAPSLQPKDFSLGIHDLTLKLSAEIDAHLGSSQPFVMVGLSMGGLVARDYVQNLHKGSRVRALFLIVTANRGTFWANMSPGGGVRDFAIGSALLHGLNADLSVWKTIPVYAYWTPTDIVVVPSVNTKCTFGQTRRVIVPFHQSMVHNPVVMADIAAKIGGLAVGTFASDGNER